MPRFLPATLPWLALLLALALPGQAAFGHKSAPPEPISKCSEALIALERETGEAVAAFHLHRVAREKSLEFVGQAPGRHGGARYRISRLSVDGVPMTWASMYSENAYDPQGDPRAFIDALGQDAARFFGFERVGESFWIPDAAEFTGALKAINAHFVKTGADPLPVGFFVPASNQDVYVTAYIGQIAQGPRFPIAPTGHHLLHDLSFHAGVVFAPAHLAAAIRGEADMEMRFFKFAKESQRDSPETLAVIEAMEYVSAFHSTIRYDVLSGVLGALMAMLRPINHDQLGSELESAINRYMHDRDIAVSDRALDRYGLDRKALFPNRTKTPRAQLLAFLIRLQTLRMFDVGDFLLPQMNQKRFYIAAEKARDHYTPDMLVKDFERFFQTYTPPAGFHPERTWAEQLNIDNKGQWYSRFCDEVRTTKERMLAAVRALSAQ